MSTKKQTADEKTMALIEANADGVKNGKSLEEIAEVLGVTASTFKQQKSKLRSDLKTNLIEGGMDPDEAADRVEATIPSFPRGRSAGSGTGGAFVVGAANLAAQMLAEAASREGDE